MTNSPQFHFTDTEPTPLLKDFETFTRYLEQNAFALGKASEYIPYKHLAALNATMSQPNAENHPRTSQEYYPQLHLFYHLALAGKLFRKAVLKSQKRLEATERLAAYRALTAAERYFFLLETLWIDCSWPDLSGSRGHFMTTYSLNSFLEGFCKLESSLPLSTRNDSDFLINFTLLLPPPALLSFTFFGWYTLERDEARYQQYRARTHLPIARLIPTDLGITLARILMRKRPLAEWNLPCLRSEGILPSMPEARQKAAAGFVDLFRHLCAHEELRKTLPRVLPQTTHGNFVFKVSVAPKVWRTIALSSKHTLDDLHDAIQDAFEFDADHLYAFYMNNQWYSDERFESPHSEEGPFADEVKIGELGLAANQPFIYHFDFGDDWRFDVVLLEIKTGEPLLNKPKILETHGKAPEQYPEADW